jgi:ppGpp synthetase/RelA/SpoT-type nucleotidyltranferase
VSKAALDKLGQRLRLGTLNESDLRELDEYRRTFAGPYAEVVEQLRRLGLEPTGRPAKSTPSIVEKLRRETIRLTQIQDIAGCRVIVENLRDQDLVVAKLLGAFSDVSVIDRRQLPSHGYRAVHVVVSVMGMPVEVQVRTTLQHLWAETSEKLSDLFDPAVKYGGGPKEVRDILSSLAESVAKSDRVWTNDPFADVNVSSMSSTQLERLRELQEQFGRLRDERIRAISTFLAALDRERRRE